MLMIEAGTKNGGNTTGSARRVLAVGFFNQRQAANARTNHHTDTARFVFAQRVPSWQTSVLNGLRCSSNAKVNEAVHGPGFFGRHVGLEIKVFDFARKPASYGSSVKTSDRTNAGLTGDQVGPCIRHRVAHGADASQTRDNNAAPGHRRSGLFALGVVDRSLHRGDFFCVFVRNLDAELVFECHHQFHRVQGVRTQISHEGFFVGDL
jgi:hypothetical protein